MDVKFTHTQIAAFNMMKRKTRKTSDIPKTFFKDDR